MAQRSPSRSGRSSRSASPSSSNATAMLFGGIAVAVVAVLLVVMSRGGDDAATGTGGTTSGAAPGSRSPAPPANLTPAPQPGATSFAAKAGKPPGRPAPPLDAATLDQCRKLLAEAKAISDEGVKLRMAGDNEQARARQSVASDKIEEVKRLTATAWLWQEEAELGEWALPAEYVNLAQLYDRLGPLENQVRRGGATR